MKQWIIGFVNGLVFAATVAIAADVKWSAFSDYSTSGGAVTAVGLQDGANVKFSWTSIIAPVDTSLILNGGSSSTGSAGGVSITPGAATASGSSGNFSVAIPDGVDGGGGITFTSGFGNVGGNLSFQAGNSGGVDINGASLEISSGNATNGNANGGRILLNPGSGVGTGFNGHIVITLLENFADDTAAAMGGVPTNGLYRTGSAVKVCVAC